MKLNHEKLYNDLNAEITNQETTANQMCQKIGKYYWVRTEAGKEIAFKRNSGAWEMHGIDCKEDLRELILDVYEEVAIKNVK